MATTLTQEFERLRAEFLKKKPLSMGPIYLKGHGGSCCGIKHIYSLGLTPEAVIQYKQTNVKEYTQFCRDYGKYEIYYEIIRKTVFLEDSSAKTMGQMFDEIVEYASSHKRRGVLEVVITHQQSDWVPHLEKSGFKLVNEFVNSNSCNTCFVYHLNYGEK